LGYTIELDAKLQAVVLRHDHPIGDSYLESRDFLIEKMRESGYRRALVVLEGPGFGTNAFQIHDHISYLATHLPRGVRVASVLGVQEEVDESRGFAEVVGSNRGLTLKVFYDEEQAVAWLNSSPAGTMNVEADRELPTNPDEVDDRR